MRSNQIRKAVTQQPIIKRSTLFLYGTILSGALIGCLLKSVAFGIIGFFSFAAMISFSLFLKQQT